MIEHETQARHKRSRETKTLPLAGIQILDMTSVMLGPYATQMLGDYGADIVKIESPSGDTTRWTGPTPESGMAATFIGVNRSKRGVVLDLKKPSGREALLKLAEAADVLIYSVRPQKMAALGLEPESLHARNPQLIIVGVHGFAEGGPYAGKPAYDDIIQGLCGLSALTEIQSGEPAYLPSVVADKTCGLFATQAILMALIGRSRSGEGTCVEVPMFEAMTSFTLAEHLYGGHFTPSIQGYGYDRLTTRFRRPYRTTDGFICIVPYTNEHWRRFFIEVGEPALSDDPRFTNISARTKNIDHLYSIVLDHLSRRSTEEWLATCERLDIPVARMNRLEDLEQDPQLVASGFFQLIKDERMGDIKTPRPALRFDQSTPIPTMPPRLGEHTVQVLQEAGLSAMSIKALLSEGAAVQWDRGSTADRESQDRKI